MSILLAVLGVCIASAPLVGVVRLTWRLTYTRSAKGELVEVKPTDMMLPHPFLQAVDLYAVNHRKLSLFLMGVGFILCVIAFLV